MGTLDTNSLVESDINLPTKDTRDEAVKDLDSLCRRCVNLAHDVAAAHSAMIDAEGTDIRAYGQAAMRFGEMRERLYNLKDLIESRSRHYNQTLGFGIFVSHTRAGLPIRVSKAEKTELWN